MKTGGHAPRKGLDRRKTKIWSCGDVSERGRDRWEEHENSREAETKRSPIVPDCNGASATLEY